MIYGYDPAVENALSTEFRSGGALVSDASRYRLDLSAEHYKDDGSPDLSMDVIDNLVDYLWKEGTFSGSGSLTMEEKNELDGWLAPRLHAALRIPRRLAADRRFWSWLAIEHFQPYIQMRFQEDRKDAVAMWRYTGDWQRNAVSRLWWGAELVRNGPDYGAVPSLFRRTRTAEFALELEYSRYRPAPIAFVRVAEGLDGKGRLVDKDMRRLSRVANAMLTLHALEAIAGYEEEGDTGYRSDWYQHRPSTEEIMASSLPLGPDSEKVPDEAIEDVTSWFRKIADGAD